jgi:hypothetical protein
LEEIAKVVSTGGTRVVLGLVPTALLSQMQVEEGADAEQARMVLMRLLAASKRRLSWRLLYSPMEGTYYLNIHGAQASEPAVR